MSNGTNKTTATTADVEDFLAAVPDEDRRQDARLLAALMRDVTGRPAVLWGTSIIGFGSRHYHYASGRQGDVAAIGFAPRKAQTVLYLTGGVEQYDDLLTGLGPHKVGKGCLYLKRVPEVDQDTLRAVIARSHELAAEPWDATAT